MNGHEFPDQQCDRHIRFGENRLNAWPAEFREEFKKIILPVRMFTTTCRKTCDCSKPTMRAQVMASALVCALETTNGCEKAAEWARNNFRPEQTDSIIPFFIGDFILVPLETEV